MPLPVTEPCETCADRRYVRTPHGWINCASCFWETITQTFVHPALRRGEHRLPDPWRTKDPWPLKDQLIETGTFDEFRHRAWRSLLHHYHPTELSYDVVEAFRLVEIQFGRDGEYTSIRDLLDLKLVVLIVGVVDPPNSYGPSLVQTILGLRQMYGRPTWVFAAKKLAKLAIASAAANPTTTDAIARVVNPITGI